MKKIIILIPIFNDWDSLKKLIFEINRQVKDLTDYLFDCYIINDGSTIKKPEIIKPESLNSINLFASIWPSFLFPEISKVLILNFWYFSVSKGW